ncbi:tyrosine-type recombinase/integrase [Natranaerobius trueperi]|uniref:Integrase n=1 Tax=Natranaerobius trueperi TaxID=759412 RepID=A0A226BZ20_9FIRM|nr:tyrosine-type recombinase/integrase [Natranaerobius trueperi]OWZ83380.1 hypothetical protein CDO51_08745 [Natranaerobius trueperi]
MTQIWQVQNNQVPERVRHTIHEFLKEMKSADREFESIKKYGQLLERFFVATPKDFEHLTSNDVIDWLNSLGDIKEATFNQYLSKFTMFFKFCEDEGYIEKVLVKKRWRAKVPKPVPKHIDPINLAKYRLTVENESLRDQAIIELLISSGARNKEICGLDIKDIDLENCKAKVLAKGNKLQTKKFSDQCRVILEKYLKVHPGNSFALFVNRNGNRITTNNVRDVVKKHWKKAELYERVYPHRFRHSFATNLLIEGKDLSAIRDALGHAFVSTTIIYTNYPSIELRKLYRKYKG